MNYQSLYLSLVDNARRRGETTMYTERHHIVPRALGGTDAANNLVRLTGREHFVAHVLLAKIHGGAMWSAATLMKEHAKSSRVYAIARKGLAASLVGKPRPPHVIAAMRSGVIDKPRPAQHCENISRANTGKRHTAETKARIGAGNRGRARTEAEKQNLRLKRLGQPGPNRGKVFSEEHRAALKRAAQLRWHPTDDSLMYQRAWPEVKQ